MIPVILLLLVLAAVLILAEMMLPTHGILGGLAVLCFLAIIVLCFYINQWFGFGVLMASAIATPFVGSWLVSYYPKTRLGRKLILYDEKTVAPPPPVHIGQEGIAASRLMPSGEAEFGPQRVEVIAEQGSIDAGQRVRVVSFINGRPAVRPLTA